MRKNLFGAMVATSAILLITTSSRANQYDNISTISLGNIGPLTGATGGGPILSFTFTDPPNGKNVIGWGIEFDYDETPDTSGSWASDIKMVLTSPGGASVTVGGFSSPGIAWDFDGIVSDLDNHYIDAPHLSDPDANNFPWKTTPQPKGVWTVTFQNNWNSASAGSLMMNNTTLYLYKVPEPASLGMLGIGALALIRRRRLVRR